MYLCVAFLFNLFLNTRRLSVHIVSSFVRTGNWLYDNVHNQESIGRAGVVIRVVSPERSAFDTSSIALGFFILALARVGVVLICAFRPHTFLKGFGARQPLDSGLLLLSGWLLAASE